MTEISLWLEKEDKIKKDLFDILQVEYVTESQK